MGELNTLTVLFCQTVSVFASMQLAIPVSLTM
jgi:hypothetical protein